MKKYEVIKMSRYNDPELLLKIKERYSLGKSIQELSEEFNIPERSLITKLSLEGVYKKKPYLNKLGKVPVKKRDIIDRIAVKLGLLEGQDACLEQCTKLVLEKLLSKLDTQTDLGEEHY